MHPTFRPPIRRPRNFGRPLILLAGAAFASLLLAACAGNAGNAANRAPAAQPGTLAYDRGVWHELLDKHTAIRRVVRHTPEGVEAVTESDDPAVAAKIRDHAFAMQARMRTGSRVRVWDPVFEEMFARHDAFTIDVKPTEKGVSISERASDQESLALMRAHAIGVSEFVRGGFGVSGRETPRFDPASPLPAPELVIGGVPHRFLLTQPDAAQIHALAHEGVRTVVNFRPHHEHPTYDEQAAAASAGITYVNLPYAGADELTDAILDSARATLRDAKASNAVVALHCRSGNRAGPAWAAYRVLDEGVPLDQALREAKAMQMRDPALETRVRAYVAARTK